VNICVFLENLESKLNIFKSEFCKKSVNDLNDMID